MQSSAILAFLLLAAALAPAQQSASESRRDGATVPLMVYGNPHAPDGSCAPVILFSPGLGGTERGYRYFGEGIAAAGYRVIIIGHKESGPEALRKIIFNRQGAKAAVEDIMVDRTVENARLLDVDAALAYADRACRAPFVALGGHSLGAITTMLEAGARNKLDLAPSGSAARFGAFIALSAGGPGPVFTNDAWSSIRKPVLMMTGTRDQGAPGDYRWRIVAYQGLPNANGSHWLGVIDGATHMDFARNAGAGAADAVVAATTLFLRNARDASWTTPPPAIPGVTWQQK